MSKKAKAAAKPSKAKAKPRPTLKPEAAAPKAPPSATPASNCAGCQYGQSLVQGQDRSVRVCRYYPPRAGTQVVNTDTGQVALGQWPIVGDADWCSFGVSV